MESRDVTPLSHSWWERQRRGDPARLWTKDLFNKTLQDNVKQSVTPPVCVCVLHGWVKNVVQCKSNQKITTNHMNEERLSPAGSSVVSQLSAGRLVKGRRQHAEGCPTCTVNVQKLLLIVNHSHLNVRFRTFSHCLSLNLSLVVRPRPRFTRWLLRKFCVWKRNISACRSEHTFRPAHGSYPHGRWWNMHMAKVKFVF